jgi:predicted PhzF superfamily epimerase YddE/YHI9
MKTLPLFQVDAFTDRLFGGNPAAVVVLDEWLDEELMQNIGLENNLSETAFVVKSDDHFEIRWFTPEAEVELCGHATLATAYVLFNFYEKDAQILKFKTLYRGWLEVRKQGELLELDFPADTIRLIEAPEPVLQGMGKQPLESLKGKTDYLLVYEKEDDILALLPDFELLKSPGIRGVIATAPGKEVDFISRFFAPAVGINEDPVTGSAHTSLIPYWSSKLGKSKLEARQVSKRLGVLSCEMAGERVRIAGRAQLFLRGEIGV